MMNPVQEQRPLGELFSELASETGTLVRKEVELAKTELTDKAKTAGRNVAAMAVGGAVVFMGALALLAGLILVLALVIPLWASALIVGAIVTGIGGALVMKGKASLVRIDPVPRETVRTLKEDRRWARQQLSR